MAKLLKEHSSVLRRLQTCGKEKREELLRKGGKPLQTALQECAMNILNYNVPLTDKEYNTLEKYKDKVRYIGKKKMYNMRKRIKIEQKGGFLSALLAPIVRNIIKPLFSKSK